MVPERMKVLVCLYSCAAHETQREHLLASSLFEWIRSRSDYQVRTILADPRLQAARLDATHLCVPVPEQYRCLSLKTHAMIVSALQLDFDCLLKIDATIVDHGARRHRQRVDVLQLLSPEAILSALQDGWLLEGDYQGMYKQRAREKGFNTWLATKGLSGSFGRVFPSGEATPPYFQGKCYMLSRRLCKFVSACGASMAAQHAEHLGGSEDLMIGRLVEAWEEMSLNRPSFPGDTKP